MLKLIGHISLAAGILSVSNVVAAQSLLDVPSGHNVTLHEALTDTLPDGQNVLRLRYIIRELGGEGAGYADVADDFQHLCNLQGIAIQQNEKLTLSQIIVSFANKETEFGVPNPDATQYFEAFSIENDTCIWEGF